MKTNRLVVGILLGAATLVRGGSGVWEERAAATLLKGRSTATAVWTGDKLLTFGGWNGRHLNDTYSYAP